MLFSLGKIQALSSAGWKGLAEGEAGLCCVQLWPSFDSNPLASSSQGWDGCEVKVEYGLPSGQVTAKEGPDNLNWPCS